MRSRQTAAGPATSETRGRPRGPRAVAHRAAAAGLLSLVVLLAAGPASALAGPGVALRQASAGKERRIYGSQIGNGQSIRNLLRLAGFTPETVTTVTVTGEAGNASVVRSAELDGAFVSDVGQTTRFFRPGRPSDDVRSAGAQPLRMEVGGSSLLAIELKASAVRVKVGETVSFSASVRVTPPGASIEFTWNFGDGTPPRKGPQVAHKFTSPGPSLVIVDALGSGGACAQTCSAQASVDIEVGDVQRDPDQPSGTPGGGGAGGTGSGGTATGSGSGAGSGGSGDPGATDTGAKPGPKPPPLRAERPEAHSEFSSDPNSGAGTTIVQGILLAGQGSTIEGGLPGGEASGGPKPKQGVPSTIDDPSLLAAGIGLALALVMLGALRERRNVRLRVA